MKGCRALTIEEIEILKNYFGILIGDSEKDKFDLACRNYTLIFFTFYTGLRISEILSLQLSDILSPRNQVGDFVYLKRKNMKKKVEGRQIVLNEKCRELLKSYMDHYLLLDKYKMNSTIPLWFSKKSSKLKLRQAEQVFSNAFQACDFSGKLNTHTGRKTFASICYEKLDKNILDLQSCLGHKNISSTTSYISADSRKVNGALNSLVF